MRKKRILPFRSPIHLLYSKIHTKFPLIFSPQMLSLVTLVRRYVSTKLEVSAAFRLRESRRHGTDGRTDGLQR